MKQGWHHKLGGSAVQKAILGIVHFWHPKANAWWSGQRWLVYSIEEWQDRLPNIGQKGKPSDRAIRRAITELKDAGVLLVERHKHPFRHFGGPVLWVRPNEAQIDRLLTAKRPNRDRELTETYIQETDIQIDREEQQGRGQSDDSPQEQSDDQEDEQVKGSDFLAAKKAQATVKSGLEVFSKAKQFDKELKASTPTRAHECLVAACKAAGYPAPGAFTAVRAGQMKTFLRRVATTDLSTSDIPEMLFFVCKKWPEFIGWAKVKFNVNVSGTVPNHGSLTMYAAEAVGFWRSYTTVSPVKEVGSGSSSSLDDGF